MRIACNVFYGTRRETQRTEKKHTDITKIIIIIAGTMLTECIGTYTKLHTDKETFRVCEAVNEYRQELVEESEFDVER